MAEYTLTLSSDEDYRLIRKILKAFDGASIRPNDRYTIEDAYEEVLCYGIAFYKKRCLVKSK